jgi:hypothetical protein
MPRKTERCRDREGRVDQSVITWFAESSDAEVIEVLYCSGAARAVRIASLVLHRAGVEAKPLLQRAAERIEREPARVILEAVLGAVDATTRRRG